MSAAIDYASHYKAVKARLNTPKREPVVKAVIRYSTPIGPWWPVWYLSLKGGRGDDAPALPPRYVARSILQDVCLKHGFTPDELRSERRFAPVIAARHELYYRLRKETPWSYPRIGEYVGGRDHTTVLHGCRRHAKRMGLPL